MSAKDSSRQALDLVHQWLSLPPENHPATRELLCQLADAFAATGVGLALLPDADIVHRVGNVEGPLPWEAEPAVIGSLREGGRAQVLPRKPSGTILAAVVAGGDGPQWLLWVEDETRLEWTAGECAALALCAQSLNHLNVGDDASGWAAARERRLRQHRLEQVIPLVRRLAHDFGNALTSILGFTELSMSQRLPPGSSLHDYLAEVHRGAKGAAEWTRLLRLFALSERVSSRPSSLGDAIRAEERDLRALWKPGAELVVDVPPSMPAVAADAENLRQTVRCLMENAYEALPGHRGVVTVTAREAELGAMDCLAYYGRPRPGRHVVLTVRDNGTGLTLEASRRLFAEAFFTTKPRRRGLGLLVVYGITAANRGGVRLENDPTGGAVAEVVFPTSNIELEDAAIQEETTDPPTVSAGGEKVLVVDDDPLVRQFVQATLQRAGYRVEAVGTTDEAVVSYHADPQDPFRLVLSDLVMPRGTGMDLARRLLQTDVNARLLFMSGRESLEQRPKTPALDSFELIQKPFRSERLLRAVRAAIDRSNSVERGA